jgi:hypothetical protein
VSAYHANRATGEALPGLLRAQDVSHFHGAAETIKNIDEANAKKREFEETQKQKAAQLDQAPPVTVLISDDDHPQIPSMVADAPSEPDR